MPNAFNKEISVAWTEILSGMNDRLVVSRQVKKYQTDQQTMQRSLDVMWRRMPTIMSSNSAGLDQTGLYKDVTNLSVPASITRHSTVPWIMTAKDLRDSLANGDLAKGAYQKIASDINTSAHNVIASLGSITVKRPLSATGFDDVATCSSALREIGVSGDELKMALTLRDYQGMAGDLAKRQTMGPKTLDAYEKGQVGKNVAGFDIYETDTAPRLLAAIGVGVTISAANQFYVPKATSTAVGGEINNVDNRFQNISIAVTSGTVRVGDRFTAGTNSVHQITKVDTGQLKTFVVVGIVSGAGGTGVVTISPPFISAQGATNAEVQYQNITATPANGATLVFLNTVTAGMNVFWDQDSIEVLPGRFEVMPDTGIMIRRGTLDNGVNVIMTQSTDINTLQAKFRIDAFWGVVNLNTEMSGVMLFGQT